MVENVVAVAEALLKETCSLQTGVCQSATSLLRRQPHQVGAGLDISAIDGASMLLI